MADFIVTQNSSYKGRTTEGYYYTAAGANDAHVAINGAITAAASKATSTNPARVFIQAGTYIIRDHLYCKSNVVIYGEGNPTVKIGPDLKSGETCNNCTEWGYRGATTKAMRAAFHFEGVTNSGIHNLRVDGSYDDIYKPKGVVFGRSQFTLVMMDGATHCKFSGLTMFRMASDAFMVARCNDVEISYCDITQGGHDAVQGFNSNGIIFHHNRVAMRCNSGVRYDNSNNGEVYDNEFYTGSGGGSAIELQNASSNISIHHNYFHDISGNENKYGAIGYSGLSCSGSGHKYYNNLMVNCVYAADFCPANATTYNNIAVKCSRGFNINSASLSNNIAIDCSSPYPRGAGSTSSTASHTFSKSGSNGSRNTYWMVTGGPLANALKGQIIGIRTGSAPEPPDPQPPDPQPPDPQPDPGHIPVTVKSPATNTTVNKGESITFLNGSNIEVTATIVIRNVTYSMIKVSNYTYNRSYTFNEVGTFSVTATMSKPGYTSVTSRWNITVRETTVKPDPNTPEPDPDPDPEPVEPDPEPVDPDDDPAPPPPSSSEPVPSDNTLRSKYPTIVNRGNVLGVGMNAEKGINRILVKPDISNLNFDIFEQNAVLKIYMNVASARTQDTILDLYRPFTYHPSYVSWQNYNKGSQWSRAGGDWYDKNNIVNGSTPWATATISSDDTGNKYVEFDITQLLFRYKMTDNPYPYTGFLIKERTESNGTYVEFASYTFNNGSNAPVINVSKIEEWKPMQAPIIYIKGNTISGTADLTCGSSGANVQINQALSYATSHPTFTKVYLKGPFTYNINEKLLIGGNITLEGDSTAIIKLSNGVQWPANTPLIMQRSSGLKNITIKGFTIDGNRTGNENNTYTSGAGYYTLISLKGVTNVHISDMVLQNNLNDAVCLTECTAAYITDNIIDQPGGDGIYALSCNEVVAYNNTITARTGNGIRIYNSNALDIHDNVITSNNTPTNPGTGRAGIVVFKNGTPVMTNVDVYNNKIYGMSEAGIWVYGYSEYAANTTSIKIHNNIIYNNGLKQNASAAGILINGFNAIISNNTIDTNYGGGIIIKKLHTADAVTGNLVMTIQNNNITNTKTGYGIDCAYLTGYTVTTLYNLYYGNAVTGSGDYGSNFTHANDTTGQDPLYIDAADGDYHEKSKCGRWTGTTWTTDAENSPCIDAGNPASDYSLELSPWNGGRINTGAFGGTQYASLTGELAGPSNRAPALTEIPNKSIRATHLLEFTVSAVDQDTGDTLTYSATNLPTGATFVPATQTFSWTPTVEQEGTYTVTFSVSDGRLSSSQEVNIGVLSQTEVIILNKAANNRIKQSVPTGVFNSTPFIDVGGTLAGNAFRTLLFFDMSEFVGKTLTSATLSLFWSAPEGQERVNDTIIDVFRPLPWNSEYASWNNKDDDVAWITAGGDWYDANGVLNGTEPFASITIEGIDVPDHTYHEINILTLAQGIASQAFVNTGFLLKARTETDNYIGFYSRNLNIASKAPKLEITYIA